MTYPDETIQGLSSASSWWLKDESNRICRGRLCSAFIPFVTQKPYTLEPVGRPQPTIHNEANAKIAPLDINQTRRMKALPVAAMPLYGDKDLYTVYTSKKRPCLILGDGCAELPKEIRRDRPSWQTAHTVIVAPYFGIEQGVGRAGFPAPFVDRVKQCEFPQFFWDILPHNSKESMLFFMQAQPIGKHLDSIELSPYKLSPEALCVIDEWLSWSFTGNPPDEEGFLFEARNLLLGS